MYILLELVSSVFNMNENCGLELFKARQLSPLFFVLETGKCGCQDIPTQQHLEILDKLL